MVFLYLSFIVASVIFSWDLLQNSVSTLADIYPQVNFLFYIYCPSKTSRMRELIKASPFRLNEFLIYSSSSYLIYFGGCTKYSALDLSLLIPLAVVVLIDFMCMLSWIMLFPSTYSNFINGSFNNKSSSILLKMGYLLLLSFFLPILMLLLTFSSIITKFSSI